MSLSKRTKTRIIFGLVSGLTYAIIMWLFDYFNNEVFNLNKFFFSFILFGIAQGLLSFYYIRKDENLDK